MRQFVDNVAKEYHTYRQMGALDDEYVIKDTSNKENNSKKKPGNNSNNNNNHQQQNNGNQQSNNNNQNSSNTYNNNNDRNAAPRLPAHQQPLAQQFKKELQEANSEYAARSVLFKWLNSNGKTCCFHNHAELHNFLQCFVTERICNEVN